MESRPHVPAIDPGSNPYLAGNYGPIDSEYTATDLEVTGTLPDFLNGRYLRNGPNPITVPDPSAYHWFMGSGMVHGARIRDGKAEWYRNRWVRSADVAASLGEDVRPGPVHAGMDFSANTNVIGHAGRTFAIVEAGSRPYELTRELETVAVCDFDGTLPGGYTAHPKRDPDTGELHAMSYFWGWGNSVQYSVIDRDGRVRRTVDIAVTGSPMMHDFSLTENHIVIYDLPCVFDLTAGAFPYRWDPDYPARVGVMARDGDGNDVAWSDVEPCYVYHPLNAYEDGGRIVADVARHVKTFDSDRNGPNEGPPTLDRWTIDPSGGKVLEERLDDRPQEFPRVDERRVGKRHRVGYAVSLGEMDTYAFGEMGALIRHDFDAGTSTVRSFGAGCSGGEFVHVAPDGDAPEESGVVMGYVYDSYRDGSDLVVLDAETLETVASVRLPTRVPFGFHGNWVADE